MFANPHDLCLAVCFVNFVSIRMSSCVERIENTVTFENMIWKSVHKNNDEDKSISYLTFEKKWCQFYDTHTHSSDAKDFLNLFWKGNNIFTWALKSALDLMIHSE